MTVGVSLVSPVPPAGVNAQWLQQLQATVNWNFSATSTTAQRPASPVVGQHLFDTTLGIPIWCKSLNPVVWCNASGTAV
jgi:hypothetical protein